MGPGVQTRNDFIDMDFTECAGNLATDGVTTFYFYNDSLKLIINELYDIPEGASYGSSEYYFDHNGLFFSYEVEEFTNYWIPPDELVGGYPVRRSEIRTYYSKSEVIKVLKKNVECTTADDVMEKSRHTRSVEIENPPNDNLTQVKKFMEMLDNALPPWFALPEK